MFCNVTKGRLVAKNQNSLRCLLAVCVKNASAFSCLAYCELSVDIVFIDAVWLLTGGHVTVRLLLTYGHIIVFVRVIIFHLQSWSWILPSWSSISVTWSFLWSNLVFLKTKLCQNWKTTCLFMLKKLSSPKFASKYKSGNHRLFAICHLSAILNSKSADFLSDFRYHNIRI